VNSSSPPTVITAPIPPFRLWTPEERRASLEETLSHWRTGEDVWVFAYGSLIWRPDFDFQERRLATLHGHHRALCLWSRVNRGTPECPGLVFALDRGGSCRGMAYRLAGSAVPTFFPGLWDREMSTRAYAPRWISCSTDQGPVKALVFIMNRENPGYIPTLPEAELLAIIQRASGINGRCTDYVIQTDQALRSVGIRDTRLEKIAKKLQEGDFVLPEN